ncbi:TIGR03943 family putative permease subunit [Mycolicibacterium palauense]|uniref:TIGR03943 family putative permease subunit n=1 Tax=Mycolicibacterium palauense TaxID=2034511 RepID=UPI000BFEFF4B|nr:TIGR03943 family protein [Mycolicibacterium palauense]
MSRETENVLVLLVGIALVVITVGGTFTRYVKPTMAPWLLVTAVVLIALSAASIVADIRRGGPTDAEAGHGHRRGIAWLLAIPIVVLVFVAPPALQAAPSTPTAGPANADLSNRRPFAPLPAGRAPEVPLPEVVMRAVNDTSGSLHDRPISVIGFVMHESDGVDLGRIVIVCCAADAQLARLHLRGRAAGSARGLAENSWVRVEGTVDLPDGGPAPTAVPTFSATSVEPIDAPRNPYSPPL